MSCRRRLQQITTRVNIGFQRRNTRCPALLLCYRNHDSKLQLYRSFNFCRAQLIKHDASLLGNNSTLDLVKYDEFANTTLDNLAEFFESLSDDGFCPEDFDVQLASGVLTVNVGGDFGTYVINKQTPNRQIWLSSPTSGPKRYDYVNESWIYLHTGENMNDLLSEEFSEMLKREIDCTHLNYGLQT